MSGRRPSCGIVRAAHKTAELARTVDPDPLGVVPPPFSTPMIRLTFARRTGLALAVGLGVAAATSAQPADRARPDAAALIERATSTLTLTADQQAALTGLAGRAVDSEAGALWGLAADVEAVLTDAQVAQLREAQEAHQTKGRGARGDRARRPQGDRMRGRRGERPEGRPAEGRRSEGARPDRPRSTDDQRAAARAIAEEGRPRAEALVERFRAGELSDDAFVAEARALRDEAASRLGEALPEQAARMQEAAARRDAAEAARDEALGLTADQKKALEALALDRLRNAPARPDVRPPLDEDGRLDRQAFREAVRAQREAARPARAAARAEADAVFTAEQKDILTVHRALAGGARRHAMRGPRDRRGGGMGGMLGPLDRLD